MAGAYPDVAANRMPLDVDGSRIYEVTGLIRTRYDDTQMAIVCNESSDSIASSPDTTTYLVAFPAKRNVFGLYLGFQQAVSTDWVDVLVEGSSDTVNGIDGNWATLFVTDRVQDGPNLGLWGHVAPGDYRRHISPTSQGLGIRVLRMSMTPYAPGGTAWSLVSVHVFGTYSADETSHRLELWHPTLDQRVSGSHFDWGNAARSSSAEKTFRVKNVSPTERATSIHVFTDALTDATPSVPPQMLYSVGGGSFVSSLSLSRLDPGQLSGRITIRRSTPSNAALGPWAVRVRAHADSWLAVAT